MIAEYSADSVLNQSEEYEDRLVRANSEASSSTPEPNQVPVAETEIPVEATEAPSEATDKPAATKEPDTSTVKDLDEIYRVSGVQVDYTSSKFCESYSEKKSPFEISANDEEILLVVAFSLKNESGSKKKINFMTREIKYVLHSDTAQYKPTIAMLTNGGLNYLKTSIAPGKMEKAVLIFEVPRKVKQADQIKLSIEEGKDKAQITVR